MIEPTEHMKTFVAELRSEQLFDAIQSELETCFANDPHEQARAAVAELKRRFYEGGL